MTEKERVSIDSCRQGTFCLNGKSISACEPQDIVASFGDSRMTGDMVGATGRSPLHWKNSTNDNQYQWSAIRLGYFRGWIPCRGTGWQIGEGIRAVRLVCQCRIWNTLENLTLHEQGFRMRLRRSRSITQKQDGILIKKCYLSAQTKM